MMLRHNTSESVRTTSNHFELLGISQITLNHIESNIIIWNYFESSETTRIILRESRHI